MRLTANWSHVLRKAWSFRLMILASLLSALEVLLPFFEHQIPRLPFATLTLVVVVLATVARLMAQAKFDDD